MARPLKEGLDYFPVDIDIMDEDSIVNVEMEHGVLAFGILMRLLIRIYRNGYYTKWTKKELFTFAQRDIGLELSSTETIINAYINEGFFNKNLWIKYGILTSRGIQKRFLRVANRREKVFMIKEFFLLDVNVDENCKKVSLIELSSTETGINENNNSLQEELLLGESTTSKASRVSKESKASIVTNQINTPPVDNSLQDSIAALALPELLNCVEKKIPESPVRKELLKKEVLQSYLATYSPVVLSCAIDDLVRRKGQTLEYFTKILSDYPAKGTSEERLWFSKANNIQLQPDPNCPKCKDSFGYLAIPDGQHSTKAVKCDCWQTKTKFQEGLQCIT